VFSTCPCQFPQHAHACRIPCLALPLTLQYVVETRATGVEREAAEGRVSEHLGTTERIVSEAQPRSPCD